MEKSKYYYDTHFSIETLKKAHDLFLMRASPSSKESSVYLTPQNLTIYLKDEKWNFDTREEFFSEYLKADQFHFDHIKEKARLIVDGNTKSVSVDVAFPSRHQIEEIFQVFENNLDASKLVIPTEPIKIFIGHGRDLQWRDLKDHLQDQHGFDVVAYEIGPRAGLSVKEVLEKMLNESSFALLALTAEDQHADGEMHARENVIHELGLFQGKMGFTRAIALLENGVQEFSNILGINQIRFSKGNIRETFGDILATIKREFGR